MTASMIAGGDGNSGMFVVVVVVPVLRMATICVEPNLWSIVTVGPADGVAVEGDQL